MAKYLFTYHGGAGMQSDPAEIEKVMAAWGAWFGNLGAAIIDGGQPTSVSRTVNADGSSTDGGGANPVTGYSIVEADSLDVAADLAKGCPILESGGSVEVGELIDM